MCGKEEPGQGARTRWNWCNCPISATAIRSSCPAVSSSASRWPAPIVIEPDVLLLDEPLSALDANLREDMRVELKRIQDRIGVTTVFVTHDQSEALAMSDQIVVMSEGRVEQVGPPEEVYNTPATEFVASFLGASNIFRPSDRC
jgi:hypothetical protein